MTEVQPKFGIGEDEITYSVAEAIVGGQLVERRAGTRLVGVAGAASKKVCGVARWDVPTTRKAVGGPQVGDLDELTVVRDCYVKVTYAAAANAGDKLKAAALGKVTPWANTDDADEIVGECFETTALGATGLARIY